MFSFKRASASLLLLACAVSVAGVFRGALEGPPDEAPSLTAFNGCALLVVEPSTQYAAVVFKCDGTTTGLFVHSNVDGTQRRTIATFQDEMRRHKASAYAELERRLQAYQSRVLDASL
jgi:hypothetical protein